MALPVAKMIVYLDKDKTYLKLIHHKTAYRHALLYPTSPLVKSPEKLPAPNAQKLNNHTCTIRERLLLLNAPKLKK